MNISVNLCGRMVMKMLDRCEEILEIEDVCQILKMSRNCVYAILKTRELKGYQQGRVWKIPKQAVIEFVKAKAGLK